MSALASILLVLVNIAIFPYLFFLLMISIGAMLPRSKSKPALAPSSRFLIVIPAHDEEAVIAKVVQSCLGVDYPRSLFTVLVIADNCSDRTAELARAADAQVIERFDESKKSKGHAIDDLIGSLGKSGELDRIDALVIVDADTTVDAHLLVAFDQDLRSGHDWIQAYYTVSNPDASWRTRLLTYALGLFNGVMLLGKTRIGLGALFRGNGMCFSVGGLRRVPWDCHGLVEDMEYAWMLRIAGERVHFQPDVAVYGEMLASGGEAAANQRRRWEFGRREVRRKYLKPLLRSKHLSVWKKFVNLCDLTMPTMGALAVLYVGVGAINLLCLAGSLTSPVAFFRPILIAFLVLSTLSIGLYAVSPFFAMHLPWRYALSVTTFPFYVCWKFWISITGRPDRWIRTPRESLSDTPTRLAKKMH
jgi:cellulose synthase/poly-beta-1,6-N-acetylglucosamine synthase-like glycosyltransferase